MNRSIGAEEMAEAYLARPEYRTRLFLAIRPPESLIPYINEVRPSRRGGEAEVSDDRLHLTFFWFGDFGGLPDALVARVRTVMDALERPSFRILLDRMVFGRGNVVLRPSEPLPEMNAFHQRVRIGMAEAGIVPPPKWRFHPHMTLLYADRPAPSQPVEWISWNAAEIVLVHSRLGSARHEQVDRWPLGTA